MNNKEIVTFSHANGKVDVWVPSDWVDVTVLHWPGKTHRYRVWQRICENFIDAGGICPGPFNFEQVFDPSEQKTWVSVLQLQQDKWAFIPTQREQVQLLTAPKAMANQFLPRHKAPFTLLAYRWMGQIELCAYRLGVLQYAQRGREVTAVWSRVIQAMPVLAAAPLYSMEEPLTRLFEAHHSVCHTLPLGRSRLARLFASMREGGSE
ncbi:MAG: hypothetical protein ACHQAX_00380 [Gammaproteobacteria bacterium]